MEEFELKGEYIELIKLIKVIGWSKSGGEASEMVDNGLIKVNGEVEFRRRNKIRVGMEVVFGKKTVVVK